CVFSVMSTVCVPCYVSVCCVSVLCFSSPPLPRGVMCGWVIGCSGVCVCINLSLLEDFAVFYEKRRWSMFQGVFRRGSSPQQWTKETSLHGIKTKMYTINCVCVCLCVCMCVS